MESHVSHNNDRKYYRIAIDTAKEGDQIFNLTEYFKGRVGDRNYGLQMTWYEQGSLKNVKGLKPYIRGNVGHYSIGDDGEIIMAPDAAVVSYVGDPSDTDVAGRVVYHFPEQMFPQEGIFYGFIGLIDDSDGDQRLSGVNVWFKVLSGVAYMGKASAYYINEIDKLIHNSEEQIRQLLDQGQKDVEAKQASLQAIVDDYKTKMSDLIERLNAQGQTANSMMETVKAGLSALETKIQQDGLFTQAEAEKFEGDIKALIKSMQDELDGFLPDDVINIKQFGAIGDGVTDDSAAFQKAINTGKEIFIPNGTYEVDTTLVPKDQSTPLVMHGQTPGKVILKSTQSKVMDFTSAKDLVMSNISSDKAMRLIDYDSSHETNDHTQDRFIQLDNIWNTSADSKVINWNHLIVTPEMDEDPLKGDINHHSGKYARYPLEIYNNGGFNAININNNSQSVEASAIGITDDGGKEVPLSSPTVLIDQHGRRAYLKVSSNNLDMPAFEGSGNAIAIGAKVSASDGGVANLKIGEKTWPALLFLERNTNAKGSIIYNNGKFMFFINGKQSPVNVTGEGLRVTGPVRVETNSTSGYTLVRSDLDDNNNRRTFYLDKNARLRVAAGDYADPESAGGILQYCQAGPSEQRPVLTNNPSDIGFMFFDRTLGKPIWWNGETWVSADITAVPLGKQVANLTAENAELKTALSTLGKQTAQLIAKQNNA